MMKTIQTLIAVACLLYANVMWSQQEYDIRFSIVDVDCGVRQFCYETQIRSADGQTWNLAGQNYRIFYDASMASYIDGSVRRTDNLDGNQYSNVLVTDDRQNVDASGFPGDIPFKSTLSLLNYSLDLMNLTNGGADLPANGDWVPTTEICFEIKQEVIDSGSDCLGLVWARAGKTDGLATAFVQISQWVSVGTTTEAFGRVYDDLDAEDGDASCLTRLCDTGGPGNENTEETCSDGLDNDEDGLIDCADPNCVETPVCEPDSKGFDLALNLRSIDCTTGMTCYTVNLSSTNDETFILGGQRYQLFYSSGVGSFVSGKSLLGDEFESLSFQASTPIENVNAGGVGEIPYEGDLGFINFLIQLSDDDVGSSVVINSTTPTPVAELCWVMTDEAINVSAVCFETTWAREAVTLAYNPSMVGIEEWIGPNVTIDTDVDQAVFTDLNSASGDEACFNITCFGDIESGNDECSDGVDNDDNGLVDCLDPSCADASVCDQGCFAQAPTLSGGN